MNLQPQQQALERAGNVLELADPHEQALTAPVELLAIPDATLYLFQLGGGWR